MWFRIPKAKSLHPGKPGFLVAMMSKSIWTLAWTNGTPLVTKDGPSQPARSSILKGLSQARGLALGQPGLGLM